MMSKFYAGIGSRYVPPLIKGQMIDLAKELCDKGYTLRSGNAEGSDQGFAEGVYDHKAQIWLPWENFNLDFQKDHPQHDYRLVGDDKEAAASVERFHPRGINLDKVSTAFMQRNYRQVIGKGEPNSKFIICWTLDGVWTGGTAQALRIGHHFNIPILNLGKINVNEVRKEINKIEALYD